MLAAATALLTIWLAGPAWADRPGETVGVPPGTELPPTANAPEDKGPPSWTGKAFRQGLVATSEPLAAELAARVLENGGNAIDAAAVAQFVLNVVEPQSSGIGGGGFEVIHLAETGETLVVDSPEETPAAGDPQMFLRDPAASPVQPFPFSVRSTSGIAVGVPGTLKGVAESLERFGTISLADALAPAIAAAENGIVVSSRLAGSSESSRLQNECDADPANSPYDVARQVFRPGGDPAACGEALREGELLVQPDLARTLSLIAEHGTDAFYDCDHPAGIAQAIVDTQQAGRLTETVGGAVVPIPPAERARLSGRMACDDLAAYDVVFRAPTEGDYRGFTVKSMSPPSSGGLTVVMILKMLEQFPIGDDAQGFGFGDFKTLNVMQEAMRLAFADRAVWMGDTDVVPDLPIDGLISDGYIDIREGLIEVGQRLTGIEADDPRPFDLAGRPEDAPREVRIAVGRANDAAGRNTTHFTVVDKYGNIVSYTSTVESGWGTGLMVPAHGFLLNNELTDFNSVPAFNPDPDNFNPGANDPAPFKRPRSSMSPTILFKGETPVAAYGSPGGSSIINTVVNMTLNLVDHGMTVQEAIDAARISLTSASDGGTTLIEPGFDPAVVQRLSDLGYNFFEFPGLGSVQAAVIDMQTGKLYGGADARRIGNVVGLPRPQGRN